jgi:hypothetical protein
MEAGGRRRRGHAVDIEAPIGNNLASSRARGEAPRRHHGRDPRPPAPRRSGRARAGTGARIKFLLDGDVGGAILAADEGSTVDVLVGIGGTPEGVIAACAMKCLDGAIFGKLYPRNDEERQAALDAGYDLDRVLSTDDLVAGNDVFFAAPGVTDGELCAACATPAAGLTSRARCAQVRRDASTAATTPALNLIGRAGDGPPTDVLVIGGAPAATWRGTHCAASTSCSSIRRLAQGTSGRFHGLLHSGRRTRSRTHTPPRSASPRT